MTTNLKPTFLIGVAGGTASGKTTLCRAIINKLKLSSVVILTMDHFYKPLTKEQHENSGEYNFDHPNAFDWELLNDVLDKLKKKQIARLPQWDFTTHSRKSEYEVIDGAVIDVILCEGILMFHDKNVLNKFDVKVYVKQDEDIRLIRRIRRDIAQRGRTLESVLNQYMKTVKPSHNSFCKPTQKYADMILLGVKRNIVAVDMLCEFIKTKLKNKYKIRSNV
eukprot:132868_1